MADAFSAQRVKLSKLLRAIRSERNLTQGQLAERTGLPQSVISKVELGHRQADFVEVVGICEAMGMSLRSFCRRWESTSEYWEDD